jgi:DUF4097 and DUF4098 domain-containing protein YvlB
VEVSFDGGVLRVVHANDGEALLDKVLGFLVTKSRYECSVVVSVPASTRVEAATVSADVLAAGLQARANVRTVSGDLTLADVGDRVDVQSVSGDLSARGVSADLSYKSVSGSLSLADGSCGSLTAKTVSGDLVLDVATPADGSYEITTVSGDVVMRTPAEPSLMVEVTSMSGELRSEFGDASWDTSHPGRRHIRQRIGNGDARLRVKTLSGDVRLVRRKDAA